MEESRAVIQNLVERVNKLSEIISPQSTALINAEVRSAFSSRTSFPNVPSNLETLPVNSHSQEQSCTSITTSAAQSSHSLPSQQRRTTDAAGHLPEFQ